MTKSHSQNARTSGSATRLTLRLGLALLLATSLPGCISMLTPPSIPQATEDVGPKPQDASAIIAHWANARYSFVFRGPFTADEISLSDPTPISVIDIPLGRKVGWQVISGPDNKVLQNEIGLNYTRFIIYDGGVISADSQDYPFPDPR